MSSKEQYKKIGNTQVIQKRSGGTNNTNNIKSYSIKKVTVEKSIKTSNNISGNNNYIPKNNVQITNSQYQVSRKYPITNDKTQTSYQSKNIKMYESSSGTSSNSSAVNLIHHPNQVNNLIHNHKFYTSSTANSNKTIKTSKTSKTVTSTRSEKSERVQSLSPVGRKKYVVETKKVEVYGRPRYSSASNSSRETNISISKSQLKQLMANMWSEENYCSNVESLCCLVDADSRGSHYSEKIYEHEKEQNIIIMKEYEAEILKLKTALNMKEQEMKKLIQNLKQSENQLKIKNKRLYEYNIKTGIKKEELDKDTHELQIISTKQEIKKNEKLDKDAHSLQIISMKQGWNDTNIPSPVNEIYIETLKPQENYEEMREMFKRKEEEIIRRKRMEKVQKLKSLEVQEMGILSIITKKPKKNNMPQHLESIMILSKYRKSPLSFQKIEEINITSHPIKIGNEVQELDGLEIIHFKKKKKPDLHQQCLNGLEIQREYDMLLVKPVWNSLKIQGTGLNLIAEPRDIKLENQEIDEFEIHGIKKPEKIEILVPIPQNKIQKSSNFKIMGKYKKKVELKMKNERIKLIGLPEKEEIDWNEVIRPVKSSKVSLKRLYEKNVEMDWNDIIKPNKPNKLFVKGVIKKEPPKILTAVNKDKIKLLPVKKTYDYDIRKFEIKLITKQKPIKKTLKMIRTGLNIKGKEQKKTSLIKNRMDSISIFGLIKKDVLLPYSNRSIKLDSEKLRDWNDFNKVMRTRDLNILTKKKMENKISKKVASVEIKTIQKQIVIKPIKANKLFIKKTEKEMPTYKLIKENKLFIKGIKIEVKKPEIILENIRVNRIFIKGIEKVEKKPEIILKEIKANKISIKGIKKIEKKPEVILKSINENRLFIQGFKKIEEKPEIILKQAKTSKLFIKGFKKIEKKPEVILKYIKENRLFIQGLKKPEIILKPIKTSKLFIKGFKIVEKKPEIILKPIKTSKLFIRGIKKIEPKPEIILKQVKSCKLSMKGIKKVEKKPEIVNWNDLNKLKKENSIRLVSRIKRDPSVKEIIKTVDWNEFIKVEKKPSINLIHNKKKIVLKKQNLNAFSFRGVRRIQRKESEKIEITNTWSDLLKAQRNAKFGIKGKTKIMPKLLIIQGDKFMIQKEAEEEIIYNDDYNYLAQQKKENGKMKEENKEKLVVIKEKEVTPILHREIRAQVVRVKEESSETSSQSEVDVLAGIKKQRTVVFSTDKDNAKLGYYKKVISGEVIFTPKNSLGVNLGGAKFKKELLGKKGIIINKNERLSGIEISGNNGEIHYENMSSVGGAIREGSYKIINGGTSGLNNKKKLTTMYQSSSNIITSKKVSKAPNDSKKKSIKKQIVSKKKLNIDDRNMTLNSGNLTSYNIIPTGDIKEGFKKITFNSNITPSNLKHYASTNRMIPGNEKIISMKKSSAYTYEHKDNGNLINKSQQIKVETFEKK